jgi:2-polyprenyl-6-methoxyphenol hydroxylase-like FAD-dependent oxidoreductase
METKCCIVGGGPAGMMLGFLLARAGVAVTVLEKHADFFRDFRGDTVHPSTLEVLFELGLLEDFLKLPHQQVTSVGGLVGGYRIEAANFSHLPTRCKFVALMPQWDFLKFLSSRARKFAGFDLRMQHEVTGLLREGGRVTGVEARTPQGSVGIRADLVVGCDGRHAVTRDAEGLQVQDFGVPIDVLWFRISRREGDPEQVLGNVNYGKALILINRGDYFQSGLIVRKGSFDDIRKQGLETFRQTIGRIAPYLNDRVHELHEWEQVKLLSVQINRLRRWYGPGLLCIGDAAHAMSPAGGVGINLAIQDAVAAANLLAVPLREGRPVEALLGRLQKRREFPARVTQQVQVAAHNGFARVFRNDGPLKVPWQLKAVTHIPGIQRVIGRVVGIGVRPEHVVRARSSWQRAAIHAEAAAIGVCVALNRLLCGPHVTNRESPRRELVRSLNG